MKWFHCNVFYCFYLKFHKITKPLCCSSISNWPRYYQLEISLNYIKIHLPNIKLNHISALFSIVIRFNIINN